jgi:DNA-binding NarL/FixJ family response regulator
VLTIHSEDNHIITILQAGAAGYLTKSVFGEEVLQSVRSVLAGEMILSASVGQRLLKYASRFPTKQYHCQPEKSYRPERLRSSQ